MSRLRQSIARFHRNEQGEASITNLMVIAVGALIMYLVLKYGKEAMQTVEGLVEKVIGDGGSSSGRGFSSPFSR